MKYRRLGSTGMKVSQVSLGAWTTYGGSVQDRALITKIVERALEGGVNYFDNADAYARGEGERSMTGVLHDLGVERHTLVLSSKVFWPMSDDVNDRGLSRKHVLESIDRTLERMEEDYLDLYFAHRYDPDTPMEEIVEAFSDVVKSGRAHYWGTSEWSAAQIAEAHAFAKANGLVAPVVEQPQYSMLYRERVEEQILPVTHPKGIGLVVWSPLAMGMLTGKYDDGVPEGSRFADNEGFAERFLTHANRRIVLGLKQVADDLGVTRAQLALAWTLRQPGVSSVITGATRVQQIEDNLGAAELELDEATIARIDAILAGDA
jgi:voltage-dependent potassium channel beta subunit